MVLAVPERDSISIIHGCDTATVYIEWKVLYMYIICIASNDGGDFLASYFSAAARCITNHNLYTIQ